MTDYSALFAATSWYVTKGLSIPVDIVQDIEALGINVKALWDYNNTLTRIVSIYLNQLRTAPGLAGADFGVMFADAIETGLNEAWRLGMRENDTYEMLDEWQVTVDGIVAEERTHIPDFAAYLTVVASNADTMGAAIIEAQGRLDLWINRYNDVYNMAVLASADEKTKMRWRMGNTEKHCKSCKALDGMVAYAREWEEAGLHPQGPPNDALECGGWRCDCSCDPTTDRRSPNALARLMDIATSGNV